MENSENCGLLHFTPYGVFCVPLGTVSRHFGCSASCLKEDFVVRRVARPNQREIRMRLSAAVLQRE